MGMNYKTNLVVLLALTTSKLLPAQENQNIIKKNLIKANFSAVILNSYVLQYERVLNNKQSIGLTFGVSPNTTLPFKKIFTDRYGNVEDAERAIKNTRYNKYNVTLEYRFYTGKNAPAGFYAAPFIRFMKMDLSQNYSFTPADGVLHHANFSGRISGFGAGVLIGYQWLLNKNWGIDFWIAGPFYGTKINANFHGVDPNGDLSESDQAELKKDIEEFNLPGYDINATISKNTSGPSTVDITLNGPYYGIRALGLCLVYRF